MRGLQHCRHEEGQGGRREVTDSLDSVPLGAETSHHTHPLPCLIQKCSCHGCAGFAFPLLWVEAMQHQRGYPHRALPATASTAPAHSTGCCGDGVNPTGHSLAQVLGGNGFCSSRVFSGAEKTPSHCCHPSKATTSTRRGSWCVFSEERHAEPNNHLVMGAQLVDVLSL